MHPIERNGEFFQSSSSITPMTNEEIKAFEVMLDAWDTKKSQIRDVIYAMTDPSVQLDIKNEPTMHAMWTKLCSTYELLGDMAVSNVLYKLQHARWTNGKLCDHIYNM